MMVILNMLLIPLFGIVGSAWATLISVLVYNTIKLLFVVQKMKLYPFTKKTLHSFGIIILVFLIFNFWEFPFHAILNIILKSILITIVYVLLNYKMNISIEINQIIEKFILRFIPSKKSR